MKPIFEAAWHFFKMYFLPLPPHDAMEAEQEEETTSAKLDGASSSLPQISNDQTTEAAALSTDAASAYGNLETDYAAAPTPSTDADNTPNPDIPGAPTTGPDFSHLVKAPEGAEERLSRGTTFRLAPAAAADEVAKPEPEESATEPPEPDSAYPAERDQPAPPAAGASDDYDVLPEDDPNITHRLQPPDDDDTMNNRGVNPFSD